MEIGQKLKEKRTEMGLSQEALAQRLAVSRQTISSWENNRSYPDIGSILKLSDLYGLSLDELLKEDIAMKKHTEQAAQLTRSYWNRLLELAILLEPFGALFRFWGLEWLGAAMQVLGILLFPPLWIAQKKLFGMEEEDFRRSILGWGLYVAAALLVRIPGDGYGLALFRFVCSIAGLVGFIMVLQHGIRLEKGTRFWLIIALYVGIPIFIIGSSLLSLADSQGATSSVQPFMDDYRVASVILGEEEDAAGIITTSQTWNRISIDGENLGSFEYVAPSASQQDQIAGIWQLIPEGASKPEYVLEVTTDNEITLSRWDDETLQWRWLLERLPRAYLEYTDALGVTRMQLEWYPHGTDSIDWTQQSKMRIDDRATVKFQFPSLLDQSLTVQEEYYHNGDVEIQTYTIEAGALGMYALPIPLEPRYPGEETYILYRIAWAGGEFAVPMYFG